MEKQKFTSEFHLLIIVISALLFSGNVSAQDENLLKGGGMTSDDAGFWTKEIIGMMDTVPVGDQIPNSEFGYAGTCEYCDGDVLRVWAAGTGYVNIIFTQEVTLKSNSTYKANAAFRDLTGTLNNFWAQLRLSLGEEPPRHENDGIKLFGFNSWLDCADSIDGTFENDACDSDLNGYGFVMPDSMGAEHTAYFSIVVGMWTDGSVIYPYDIVIDDVSLVDSAGTGSVGINRHMAYGNVRLTNYPNPFRETTTISYQVSERTFVDLRVYNLLGEEIAEIVAETKEPGYHTAVFDASAVSSGIFICKLKLENRVISRKINVLK